MRPRLTFERQIVFALLIVAVVPMLFFGIVALARLTGSVRAEAERGAVAAAASVRTLAGQMAGRLSSTAESWATSQPVVDLVAASDAQGLQDQIASLLVERGTVDSVAIVTPDRVLAASGEAADLDRLEAVARGALAAVDGPADELGPELVALPSGIDAISIRAIRPVGGASPGDGAVLALARRLDAGFTIDAAQLTGFDVAVYLMDGTLSAASDRSAASIVGPPATSSGSAAAEVRDLHGYAAAFVPLVAASGANVGYLVTSGRLAVLNEIDDQLGPVLVFGFVVSSIGAVLLALLVSLRLRRGVAMISGGLAAVAQGDTSVRLDDQGQGAMAALAASHNRLAATLERRDMTLGRSLGEVEALTPDRGAEDLADAGIRAAVEVFGLAEARLEDAGGRTTAFVGADARDPGAAEPDEGGSPGPAGWAVPGAAPPVEVAVAVPVAGETWRLVARSAPGRDWSEADTALLMLYGRQLGAAIRDAELYAEADDRAAALGRLSRLQTDFLRGVSHNLRTPLTRIGVVAEDLQATHADDPIVVRDARLIGEEGERLAYLLAQLLALTRLDADALAVSAEPVAIPPLVRRVAPIATDRAVVLVDEASGLVPIGDPAAVEQVLWMLLDNAAKYGGDGEIRVRISRCPGGACAPGAHADACVAVGVEDDGPGVPTAEREEIFERFVRGSTAGEHAGTGLGLDVARSLLGAMGGTIGCEDAPGGGARFVFTLPAEEASPPA